MNRHAILAALLMLGSTAAPAAAAAAAERSFSVTGFDRIRIDGPYRVKLTTGVAPFAKASGSAAAIDGVALEVQGRTLVVHPNRSSWGGFPGESPGPVEITVGTHELSAAWLNGSGSLEVDKVKGLSFDLSIQGSGSARIAQANVDQFKLGMSGAASASLAGTVPKLTAVVRGTSNLDATALKVKDATVGAEGPSVVQLNATGEVTVDAKGIAAVEFSGSPACTVRAAGSATVSGCKTAAR